jgi:nitrate reductase gamma subunit
MVPDGVTAEFDHFLGLEDYHSQLMGIVKISGTLATATGSGCSCRRCSSSRMREASVCGRGEARGSGGYGVWRHCEG